MGYLRSAQKMLKTSPWYVLPLLVFAVSRVMYYFMVSATAHLQTVDTSGESRGVIDYWTVLSNWDAGTYYYIAEQGYPDGFLYNADGTMAFNELAFYPLWPQILSLFHTLTGLSYPAVASLLSITLGAAAILMLYRFVQQRSSQTLASLLLVWLCFYPTSIILQMGYSESLTLLLIVVVLKLIDSKHFYWTLLPITLLAFTRPVVLGVGIMLAVYGLYRLVQHRRGNDDLPWSERIAIGVAGVYSGLAFGFWPLYVGYVTEDPMGYVAIQNVWRVDGTLTFFNPFIAGWAGLTFLAFFIGLALIAFASILPLAKRGWPLVLALWAPVYLVYIYLTTGQAIPFANGKVYEGAPLHITTSVWRYLFLCILPLLPFSSLLQKYPSKMLTVAVFSLMIIAGLVGSYFYITYCVLDRTGFLGAP